MSIDPNKQQVDIDNLKKQNVNDLLSIKELYRKLEEMEERISQIKYIDSTLANKIKKEYEGLKKQILDENIVLRLDNKIVKNQLQLDKKINENKLETDNKINETITLINSNVDIINAQLEEKAKKNDLEVERNRINSLVKLENSETEGNTELVDIRIGQNGNEYTTAGESVRRQFEEVYNNFVNFSKGYITKTTQLEGTLINAWIWKNNSGSYITEDNTTSCMMKYKLIKGNKYFISGNSENAKVLLGFSSNDYKTSLYLEFPKELEGNKHFEYEFIAERPYVYVYYGKTTNSSSINCALINDEYLGFMKEINDDITKYSMSEYTGNGQIDSSSIVLIRDIMIVKGHEYEIEIYSSSDIGQSYAEIGIGNYKKILNKANFDFSTKIKFNYIADESSISTLWLYLKNNETGINVTGSVKDVTGLAKIPCNVNLSFTNGGFNGGAIDYDSTTMIRSNNILAKKGYVYLITYPTSLYSVYNINKDGSRENHETYGSFSVIGDDTFIRLSFAKIDGSDLNISNFDTNEINVTEVPSKSFDYDITIASSNTHITLKEKADIVIEGDDRVKNTRLLQSIIGCDSSIRVLFYPGVYLLDEVHQTKSGQNGILSTNEYIKNNNKQIDILGYHGSVFTNPRIDFRVTQELHESLSNTDESAIFLIPNSESGNVTNVNMTMIGIMVQNYNIDKPIVAVDFTNGATNTVENVMIKVQKYDGYKKFTEEPNAGLVGLRVGYGSCYGIRNNIKHVSVRHHYVGHSCNGEHYIYEDVKAHDCMIGFAFGDKHTQPKFEHPNIMIGCSIEQCGRLMLLSKYGETVESEVTKSTSTLICIGLSTEPWFKGIGDGEGYETKPIKEVIKGNFRGRIEADYHSGRNVFEKDGSGKNMTYISY